MGALARQAHVLLWKEWRQMRALCLGLAIGGGLFIAGTWVAGHVDRTYRGTAVPAMAVFLLFSAAVLGSVAVAAERRSGALRFLLAAPVSVRSIWLTKVAYGVASWLVFAVTAAAFARLFVRGQSEMEAWRAAALEAPLWAVPVFCTCFLLSSGLGRPLLALVLGPVVGLCLLVLTVFLSPLFSAAWTGAVLPVAVFCCLAPLCLSLRVLRRERAAGRLCWSLGALVLLTLAAHGAALGIGFVIGRGPIPSRIDVSRTDRQPERVRMLAYLVSPDGTRCPSSLSTRCGPSQAARGGPACWIRERAGHVPAAPPGPATQRSAPGRPMAGS